MAVVGLIPARGGSKGLPGKNIAACAGRPLLAWTCEAALEAELVDRVLLTTDDPAIADVGRECGVEVPFLRPAELATDASPALPTIQHALDWLEHAGERVEAIVLLQPTSPLRRVRHIDEAVGLFRSARADTVVSVVTVPHNYHPASLMRERGGELVPYLEGRETITRRQDVDTLYARNGPAVLVMSAATLHAARLYGRRTVAYVMDRADSLDIDDAWDLRLAELILADRTENEHHAAG